MKSGSVRDMLRLLLLAAITSATWARSWVDVVDTTVYMETMGDPYRDSLKVEVDPLAGRKRDRALGSAPIVRARLMMLSGKKDRAHALLSRVVQEEPEAWNALQQLAMLELAMARGIDFDRPLREA